MFGRPAPQGGGFDGSKDKIDRKPEQSDQDEQSVHLPGLKIALRTNHEGANAIDGSQDFNQQRDDDGERQKDLLSLLRSQRVEGILLVMAAAPTPQMPSSPTPFAFIGEEIGSPHREK